MTEAHKWAWNAVRRVVFVRRALALTGVEATERLFNGGLQESYMISSQYAQGEFGANLIVEPAGEGRVSIIDALPPEEAEFLADDNAGEAGRCICLSACVNLGIGQICWIRYSFET